VGQRKYISRERKWGGKGSHVDVTGWFSGEGRSKKPQHIKRPTGELVRGGRKKKSHQRYGKMEGGRGRE